MYPVLAQAYMILDLLWNVCVTHARNGIISQGGVQMLGKPASPAVVKSPTDHGFASPSEVVPPAKTACYLRSHVPTHSTSKIEVSEVASSSSLYQ